MRTRNFLELDGPVPPMERADDLAGGHIEGGEE